MGSIAPFHFLPSPFPTVPLDTHLEILLENNDLRRRQPYVRAQRTVLSLKRRGARVKRSVSASLLDDGLTRISKRDKAKMEIKLQKCIPDFSESLDRP